MPIEFEVDTELQPKPYVDNVGIAHIEFALGADLDNGVVPVMSVMLVPGGACQEGDQYNNAYDLRFGIRLRDVDHEWRVTAPDFTKEAVEKYIRREDRPLVLECICKATRYLLDSLNPAQVTMSTFYADLEPKALQKYDAICAEAAKCHYPVGECFDGTDGKRYWLFERID